MTHGVHPDPVPPRTAVPSAADPTRPALLRERLRLHQVASPGVVAASALAGVVAAALAQLATGPAIAIAWLVALVAALLLRLVVRTWQARTGADAFEEPHRWLQRHRLAFLAHGLAWAALVALLPADAPPQALLALLLIVSAMVGGSLVTAAFDPLAASLFALPAGLPVVARLAGVGGDAQPPLLVAVVVFVVMMGLSGLRVAGRIGGEVRARLAERQRADEVDAARDALARQAALHRQLVDGTGQGYWHIDADGRTIDLNPAMCRMLGRPREAVLGHAVHEFFAGPEGAVLARELARRREGVTGGYAVDIVRPDGSRVHAFNQATPIRDASGRITGSIGLWTDLTEVRRLEQDLWIHERVVDSITDAVAVVDPDRRFRLVNDAWCAAHGTARESVVGSRRDDVLAGLGLSDGGDDAALRACLADGSVGTVTVPARRPDGVDTVLQTRVYPYRGASGAAGVEGAILVTRDVGDQARDRAAVETAAAYLRHTLDATGDAIFANDGNDPNQPVRFANQRMLELFGLDDLTPATVTPAHILAAGQRLYRDGAGVRTQVARIIAAGVRHESTVELLDGRVFYRRFEPAPVGGRTLRVWAFRDITASQRAAEALAAARDEAERANLAKSRFLSQMSHELRTPMNAVVGFARLLASDDRAPLAPHQQAWATQILGGAAHLQELINELLDLGRIESGQLALAPEPVPVAPLVDECLGLVRSLADGCGVRLQPTVDRGGGGPVTVRADRLRLRQVLLNLLGNAIKYNRPGGEVQVEIAGDGPVAVVSVRDTGPGLRPEVLPRLFQPFDRLDAAGGPVEGTGIGLALSRRLVEAMGGRLEVDSTHGVGSRFSVHLAAAVADADGGVDAAVAVAPPAGSAVAAPAATEPAVPAAGRAGERLRVLCVDDNPVNLLLAEAILAREPDLDCRTLADPRQVTARVEAWRPDVVLLDIHMPELDGHAVLARLRAGPSGAGLPVVAVSADATADERAAASRAGFDAYLTKPVDAAALVDTVRRLARRRVPAG